MSSSVDKYFELEEFSHNKTPQQRGVSVILQIIKESYDSGCLDYLLQVVQRVSNEGRDLSPTTVFQIAGDEAKVEETCVRNNYKK
jgi:hypothetical protein